MDGGNFTRHCEPKNGVRPPDPIFRHCLPPVSPYVAGVVIELINTGAELLLGRILNTHQQWICRQLSDFGYSVSRQITVDDSASAIEAAVAESLERADLVITTGGLGPTCDDRTRERVAALLGRRLVHREEVMDQIRGYFARFGRPMPDRTKVEALVPEGAIILPNAHGTAPGLAILANSRTGQTGRRPAWLVLLPGPPRELRPMFTESVIPLLHREYPLAEPHFSRTWRTSGIGESFLEERLEKPLQQHLENGMDLGFCARVGEVEVRLAASGADAPERIASAAKVIEVEVGDSIFGEGDELLEMALVRRLRALRKTVAVAESCTGGHIANRLTNVPGASEVLLAGYVTYSNASKVRMLGVRQDSLREYGAVSEAVAHEMAEGARRDSGADFALSITGIAGPGGAPATKPVGTVFMALASPKGTTVKHHLNALDRETFKFLSAQQAMMLLWRELRSI